MKIYTKTGDTGETGLWGGLRIAKDAARVQAYGTVDECNAAIGVARASGVDVGLDAILARIQDQLFVVGADLATPGEAANIPRIGTQEIAFLEQSIDALEEQLEPLKQFILPGWDAGCGAAAPGTHDLPARRALGGGPGTPGAGAERACRRVSQPPVGLPVRAGPRRQRPRRCGRCAVAQAGRYAVKG